MFVGWMISCINKSMFAMVSGGAKLTGLLDGVIISPPMRLDGYMTLANMRANGVRSLFVYCHACHHEAVVNVDAYAGDLPVPSFAVRMRCKQCGKLGADVRPHWNERANIGAFDGHRPDKTR